MISLYLNITCLLNSTSVPRRQVSVDIKPVLLNVLNSDSCLTLDGDGSVSRVSFFKVIREERKPCLAFLHSSCVWSRHAAESEFTVKKEDDDMKEAFQHFWLFRVNQISLLKRTGSFQVRFCNLALNKFKQV